MPLFLMEFKKLNFVNPAQKEGQRWKGSTKNCIDKNC